ALIPLPPRVARAVDQAAGGRVAGPLLLSRTGRRLDRFAATRIVRRLAKRAGIAKRISPHSLRHSFITAALDPGVPLRGVQIAAGVCFVLGAGSVLLAIPQFGDKGAGSAGVFVRVGLVLLSGGFMLWRWLFAGKQTAQDIERDRAAEAVTVEELNAALADVD